MARLQDDNDSGLAEVAARLERERALPSPSFRGELGRYLNAMASTKDARPARLRVMIGAYAGIGSALLAFAGVGLAGIGPFAA